MTKAMFGAITLDSCLREKAAAQIPTSFSGAFFQKHDQKTRGVWYASHNCWTLCAATDSLNEQVNQQSIRLRPRYY